MALKSNIFACFFLLFFIISCGDDDDAGKTLQTKPQSKIKTEKNEIQNAKSSHLKHQEVLKSLDDLLLNARQKSNIITKDALKNKIGSPNLILIDVREAREFRNGNIKSSVNIPRGILEFELFQTFPDIDKNTEIILYDRKGTHQAPLSAEQLMRIGFKNVFVLDGGWIAWIEKPVQAPKKDSVIVSDGE